MDLDTYFRDVGANFTTIPQFFKQQGYKSINVGKMFHRSGPGGDDDISWTEKYVARGAYRGNGNSWEAVSQDTKLVDSLEADYVIERLGQLAPDVLAGQENFFLGWGLRKPHLPFIFPEEYAQFYPEEDIQLPANPWAPEKMPNIAWSSWNELRTYSDIAAAELLNLSLGDINVTLPDQTTKALRRAYYATVSYIDAEIGRVLDHLDQLGLAESTIVMLWGDHGWQLGEHAEWCKHTNFEVANHNFNFNSKSMSQQVANHAPLIFAMPQASEASSSSLRTSKLVEFVDIFPTLVEATGFQPLDICPMMSNTSELCTEGASLMPLLDDPELAQWKSSVFWQYPRREIFIKTQRYINTLHVT